MTDGQAKAVLYDGFARVAGALASPPRIELVNLLAQGERGVDDLVVVLAELVKQVACDRLPAAREAARAWVGDDGSLQPVTRAELALRIRAGSVLVLDVRPAAMYAAGHISGALSIPLPGLPASLDKLPRDTDIVAYCRGRYCAMSPDAVRILRGHG